MTAPNNLWHWTSGVGRAAQGHTGYGLHGPVFTGVVRGRPFSFLRFRSSHFAYAELAPHLPGQTFMRRLLFPVRPHVDVATTRTALGATTRRPNDGISLSAG